MILENLETAGVQQAHKAGSRSRSRSTRALARQVDLICAEGPLPLRAPRETIWLPRGSEKRAASVHRTRVRHRVTGRPGGGGARRLADAGFDVLIAFAFSYDALTRLRLRSASASMPVLKAHMNADLHMADDLEEHGQGQPIRHLRRARHRHPAGRRRPRGSDKVVKINGVDVFHPQHGRGAQRRTPRASPAGSSTPITTKKVSLSATPIS